MIAVEASVERLDPVVKLERTVRPLARNLDRAAAGTLVEIYYRWQEHRIALNNQLRAQSEQERPTEVIDHFATQVTALERQMVGVLGEWARSRPEGEWAQAQKGIGPVLSAGLGAHVDIHKAPTVGHIWRFAGLDPTIKWGKGEKRPYNAELKVLCWRIGDSFVKVSGRDDAYYGQVYRERKKLEVERNEAGLFADQAKASLEARNIKDKALKATYEAGLLPPGRLDLRARRYAVKLFLSAYHEVAYRAEFGTEPPLPYPIAHLGHAHYIAPPGQ